MFPQLLLLLLQLLLLLLLLVPLLPPLLLLPPRAVALRAALALGRTTRSRVARVARHGERCPCPYRRPTHHRIRHRHPRRYKRRRTRGRLERKRITLCAHARSRCPSHRCDRRLLLRLRIQLHHGLCHHGALQLPPGVGGAKLVCDELARLLRMPLAKVGVLIPRVGSRKLSPYDRRVRASPHRVARTRIHRARTRARRAFPGVVEGCESLAEGGGGRHVDCTCHRVRQRDRRRRAPAWPARIQPGRRGERSEQTRAHRRGSSRCETERSRRAKRRVCGGLSQSDDHEQHHAGARVRGRSHRCRPSL
mmetsp:Transcript_25744/g.65314  ORF Transcript_25744/g.65314 Transcript_25744/m.65314 type:complete len:307 (-) Transcript_25744:30-950(-)